MEKVVFEIVIVDERFRIKHIPTGNLEAQEFHTENEAKAAMLKEEAEYLYNREAWDRDFELNYRGEE